MLVENEYFNLFLKDSNVYIFTKQKGYSLKSFDEIMRKYPRLKLISFPVLRNALTELGDETMIGTWRPLVELKVAPDKLECQAVVNVPEEELEANKVDIVNQLTSLMDETGIIYGRKEINDCIIGKSVPFIVAEGKEAKKGADAVLSYIERPPRKPVIRDDGSANHYELNFVFPIEEHQWLGEKIPATDGEKGVDIYGNPITADPGSDAALQYDRSSVYEVEEDNKIVLRALHSGTLEYIDGVVSVGKLLIVEGDVGPNTGDISFDGAVKVYGTVHAGYSINATGDISIEAEEGITNANMIQSIKGDIYIKGGVFGGTLTTIGAFGNIFLKHANNCKLYAEDVHAGLYLFGTEIVATNVYVDQHNGRIIGGIIEALYSIECAIAGNLHERETILRVIGIDKQKLRQDSQRLVKELKERYERVEKLNRYLESVKKASNTTTSEQHTYRQAVNSIEKDSNEIATLEKEIQANLQALKTTKQPQIHIYKSVFPGTSIEIGKAAMSVKDQTSGLFKIVNGEIKYEVLNKL